MTKELLELIKCPVKLGLTGTLPNDRRGRLSVEGSIGPVIARLTIREGIEKGILSIPKITLVPVPKIGMISRQNTYYDIRDFGVHFNSLRNKLIVQLTIERMLREKSCLIIVNEIKHGKKLQTAFDKSDFKIKFLQGAISSKVRAKVKEQLIGKKLTSFQKESM